MSERNKLRSKAPKPKKVTTIDWETWAASGGTAGIYGKAFRAGTLKIVSDEEEKQNG